MSRWLYESNWVEKWWLDLYPAASLFIPTGTVSSIVIYHLNVVRTRCQVDGCFGSSFRRKNMSIMFRAVGRSANNLIHHCLWLISAVPLIDVYHKIKSNERVVTFYLVNVRLLTSSLEAVKGRTTRSQCSELKSLRVLHQRRSFNLYF